MTKQSHGNNGEILKQVQDDLKAVRLLHPQCGFAMTPI